MLRFRSSTVIGIGIALLIGGAVVTESVFCHSGLGRLTVDAILRRDYPVIQGVVLLLSFVYVLVNLGIDLLYTGDRSEDPLLSPPPAIAVPIEDVAASAVAPRSVAAGQGAPRVRRLPAPQSHHRGRRRAC